MLSSDRACLLRPRQLLLEIHKLLQLRQKPAVNLTQSENLLDAEPGAQGVADEEDPFGVGHTQLAGNDITRKNVAVAVKLIPDAPRFAVTTKAATANLERAQTLLQAFLESAA